MRTTYKPIKTAFKRFVFFSIFPFNAVTAANLLWKRCANCFAIISSGSMKELFSFGGMIAAGAETPGRVQSGLLRAKTKMTRPILAAIVTMLGSSMAFATATVTTAPSLNMSADTAATGGTGAYTALGNIVLTEGANRDVGTGTIILNAPTGFQFNTGATVTMTVTRVAGSSTALTLSNSTATVAAGTITIGVSAQDSTSFGSTTRSSITWAGIQVRPTAGTFPATNPGTITESASDTATITGITAGTTSFGTLTEVAGAANAAHSTISPATASITANGTSTQVITVNAQDQFGNNVTTGGSTVVFSLFGSGGISGTTDNGDGTYTATVTSPTALGSGTVTATLGGTAVGSAVSASSSVISYTLGVTQLATAGNKTSGTSIAVTVPAGGVPIGNTVILSFAMDPVSGTVSATDTQGNSYTDDEDNMIGTSGSGSGVRMVVLSAHVTTALVSGNTITVTFPTATAKALSACYISGLVTASRVDQTASGGSTTAATSGATGSATTLYQDEVLIGAVGIENAGSAFTVGSGYTALTSAESSTTTGSSSIEVFPEYQITSATGAFTAGGSGWTSSRWAIQCA
jgi:hypothetical protein